jgi:Zn-dependent protease
MLFSNLSIPILISNIFVLVIAFTFHEYSHARTADYFGDGTPRAYGRLTLNPLAHLDLIGSLLLLVSGFGWAKPVPINPYALQKRSPAAVMWVSLAGPFSNLLMAILAAMLFRLGVATFLDHLMPGSQYIPSATLVFENFIWINLILMLFNLIPIAPLDGEKIFDYFLPPSFARFMDAIRPYGPIILIVVIFGGQFIGINILGTILLPPLQALFNLLVG